MLFFPYSADLRLGRIPVVTILISLICMGVYFTQYRNEQAVIKFATEYCGQSWGRNHDIAMSKLADGNSQAVCANILLSAMVARDKNKFIREVASQSRPFKSLNKAAGQDFVAAQLEQRFKHFKTRVPAYKTADLWYYPESFHIGRMITAAFAHGGWDHLAGNLFFFFAFAASIEVIVGNIIFPLIIIALSIGTHTFYSLAMMANAEALPTVGLSGVVMGMIGMFVYFIPMERIKCFLWILFYVRRIAIPAWILAGWYVGWDIYNLYSGDGKSNINFAAHVSGAALGYLLGVALFRKRKQEILALSGG